MKHAVFALLCLNAFALASTSAGAQTMPPSDAAAKQGPGSAEAARTPADPAKIRACTAQAAAKRDPERKDFIKFCLEYDGSAAASVFAWNKKTLKM